MKKRLMIGLAAGALMAAMLPGVASADKGGEPNANSVNHANLFSKVWEGCGSGMAASPHWTPEFNPSIRNEEGRTNDCGRLVSVDAGWLPEVPEPSGQHIGPSREGRAFFLWPSVGSHRVLGSACMAPMGATGRPRGALVWQVASVAEPRGRAPDVRPGPVGSGGGRRYAASASGAAGRGLVSLAAFRASRRPFT